MRLIDTFEDFADGSSQMARVIFEAAMVKRLEECPGYSLKDLLFEVCELQGEVDDLRDDVAVLTARMNKKGAKKAQEPKEE